MPETPVRSFVTNLSTEIDVFEPICKAWLGIVDDVKTKILRSNVDFFIPELNFQV